MDDNRISIWFFIGSLLTIYGFIIFIVSVPQLLGAGHEPDVVLPGLHAGVWWGILLVALGVMYVVVFWPWKKKKVDEMK
jgi:hypothetical protein